MIKFPILPYNDLPLLPPENLKINEEINKLLYGAGVALSKLSGKLEIVEELGLSKFLILPLFVKESVESSKIENIVTTTENVFKAEFFEEATINYADKEAINYKEALFIGWELIKEKGKIDIDIICKIHDTIIPTNKGIRDKEVHIGNSKKTYYTPPKGKELLVKLLNNLVSYIDKPNDYLSLVRLAVFHSQFESIHPFEDGNGRTGRILMVLYLCQQKIIDLPLLYISEYINSTKDDYYRYLREVNYTDNWDNWIKYLLKGLAEQSKKNVTLLKNIFDCRTMLKKELKEQFGNKYSLRMLEYFISSPYYSQKALAKTIAVNRQTAGKYLNELSNKTSSFDFIQVGVEKMYFYKPLLKILL